MRKENQSDMIENYIKNILEQETEVFIKRSDLAKEFNCVPSQINYVIKTRFNPSCGYVIESKRGGSGYIRIVKAELTESADYLFAICNKISDTLTDYEAKQILSELAKQNLISAEFFTILNSLLKSSNFVESKIEKESETKLRAIMFKQALMMASLNKLN